MARYLRRWGLVLWSVRVPVLYYIRMTKTITFEHFIGDEAGMERLVSVFNASQSQVRVQTRRVREGLREEATEGLGLLPSYLGRRLPEVTMVYGEFVATLADQGRIRPLDDFIGGAGGLDLSAFVAGALDSARYRGQVWALPIEGNPYALFCNLALLEQVGATRLPETWGDVFQLCTLLTADADGDGRTDRFGCMQDPLQVPVLMWQFGAELVNEDASRAAFDSENAAQALKFHLDLCMHRPPHGDFARGDTGMTVGGVEDYLSSRYAHLDYEIVPLPRGRRAANSFGGADSTLCLAIVCGEPECERAAWRFLRWFTTQEGAMRWVEASACLPLLKPVLASAEYGEFAARWPKLRTFVDQLGVCHACPCIPEYPAIKWALDAAVREARFEGGACSIERVRAALRRQAAQVQEVMNRRLELSAAVTARARRRMRPPGLWGTSARSG